MSVKASMRLGWLLIELMRESSNPDRLNSLARESNIWHARPRPIDHVTPHDMNGWVHCVES